MSRTNRGYFTAARLMGKRGRRDGGRGRTRRKGSDVFRVLYWAVYSKDKCSELLALAAIF